MAHYAFIDTNNKVVAVIVGIDENELIDGLDPEKFYAKDTPYTVKRTSYNGKIRKNYAGIGFDYDPILDAFIPPKPFATWTLDQDSCQWMPPKSRPEGFGWVWDEQLGDWVNVEANA